MAFNGSGTFNRLYDWTTDEGNGINIEASRMDGEDDGFATGLSTCITKDGQTTITANIPFNSKKITGLANGSARTDSIALGQVQDNTYGTLGTLGGSADTYTATPSPAITAYATGMEFNMKVNADNTGASTLNVSAVAAKSIKKYDGAGSKITLEAGDLQQDQYYKVIYDGTDFVLMNPKFNAVEATTTTTGVSLLSKRIIISNNGSDSDHDIDFAAGVFQFSGGDGQAAASALIKQIDATWASGTNAGGLADGVSLSADTWYHCYALSSADGSSTDFGFDTSTTAANLLADSVVVAASLTKYARVGSVLTDSSSNILGFIQTERYFIFNSPILDFSSASATSSTSETISVPLGFKIMSLVNLYWTGTGRDFYLRDPDSTDLAVSVSASPLTTITNIGGVSDTGLGHGPHMIMTNTSSQIAHRATGTGATLRCATVGYIDINL